MSLLWPPTLDNFSSLLLLPYIAMSCVMTWWGKPEIRVNMNYHLFPMWNSSSYFPLSFVGLHESTWCLGMCTYHNLWKQSFRGPFFTQWYHSVLGDVGWSSRNPYHLLEWSTRIFYISKSPFIMCCYTYIIVEGMMDAGKEKELKHSSRVIVPRLKTLLCHLLTILPWSNYINNLSLKLPLGELERIVPPSKRCFEI